MGPGKMIVPSYIYDCVCCLILSRTSKSIMAETEKAIVGAEFFWGDLGCSSFSQSKQPTENTFYRGMFHCPGFRRALSLRFCLIKYCLFYILYMNHGTILRSGNIILSHPTTKTVEWFCLFNNHLRTEWFNCSWSKNAVQLERLPSFLFMSFCAFDRSPDLTRGVAASAEETIWGLIVMRLCVFSKRLFGSSIVSFYFSLFME